MPAERTIMRQVREVPRLKFVGGVPIREIARRIGVAASTVRETIRRFWAAGLNWPLPDELTDVVLEAKLFGATGTKQGYRGQIEPDWQASIASSSASTSRYRSSGTSISSAIRKATVERRMINQ